MATQSEIITKAREITGNKQNIIVGESYIPDDAIVAGIADAVVLLNTALGTSTGIGEVIFTATPGQQDYLISTTISASASKILDVIRSGAHVPDTFAIQRSPAHDTGEDNGRVDWGFQTEVAEVITGQRRARASDMFAWEVTPDQRLRLMPVPVEAEVVAVRYSTTNASITSLPPTADRALVYSAVVAIQNAVLNRIMGDPATVNSYGQVQKGRVDVMIEQRNYYQARFNDELRRIGG